MTEQAGLANAGDGNYGMGVALGDYDNDGFPDLYVTSYGKNILYHNNGDGTFTDVTAKAGVAAGGWSLQRDFSIMTMMADWTCSLPATWNGTRSTAKPAVANGTPTVRLKNFPRTTSILYHNNGDGTFKDVSQKSGIAAKKGRALGVAFADYDGDGFTDIFVANDGMQQYLYHNNGNGTFTERGLEAGAGLSEDGRRLSGMGVVFQDYDNDGRPDIIVTEFPAKFMASTTTRAKGIQAIGAWRPVSCALSGSSGWGVGLEDFDNDGWKDLFVAQGHVLDNVEQIDPSLHYWELPLLATNHNGRFERARFGSSTPTAGRGAAFGDLNNDGWMDVVMTSLGGRPQVYLNRGGKQHWLVDFTSRYAQQS